MNSMADEPVKESKNFINLGVILNEEGKVLVVRRAVEETVKNNKILKWAFPGGRQRADESRAECVSREVLLETGFKIKSLKEISLRLHPDLPILAVYHLCQLEENKQVQPPSEPEEIAEVKWVRPEDLKNLFTTSLDPKVAQELKIA